MLYSKKQNLFKTIVFSRGMALGVLIAILLVGYGLISLVGKSVDAAKARKVAESQALDLKQKEADLSKKLNDLNTPDGQEAALREQYPVVKQGEHVVVITGSADQVGVTQSATPATNSKSGGLWNFLRNLFH